jgi:hypothetical protein
MESYDIESPFPKFLKKIHNLILLCVCVVQQLSTKSSQFKKFHWGEGQQLNNIS